MARRINSAGALRVSAVASPQGGAPAPRSGAHFDWAKAVIDRLRGVHPRLEAAFDAAYARRP